MPLQHYSRFLSVDDARIYQLLTEPGAGVGAATYGTGIDAPGIRKISWKPGFDSKELRGDNTVLDTDVIPGSGEGELEYAKTHLDLLAILFGGTVADSGSTPNQVATFSYTGGQLPRYWKVEAQCKTADLADVHVVIFKCKITDGPQGDMMDSDYGIQNLKFKFVQPRSTDPSYKINFNESLVAITG